MCLSCVSDICGGGWSCSPPRWTPSTNGALFLSPPPLRSHPFSHPIQSQVQPFWESGTNLFRVGKTTLFRVGYTVQPYSEYSWARDNCFASRQRNRASVTSTNKKNGVAPANIGILQESTIFWSENIVTLSRQCCLVPSSDTESGTPQFKVRYNLIFYESDPFSPIMIPLWRIIYYLCNKILNIPVST